MSPTDQIIEAARELLDLPEPDDQGDGCYYQRKAAYARLRIALKEASNGTD